MPGSGSLNGLDRRVENKAQDDELVMGLVELTLACPPGEREDYLRSACANDSQLLTAVWKYVTAEHRMNGFLLDPLYPRFPTEPLFQTGDLLDGRFRIVRLVAEGGMGVVYEARDEKLDRRIAIKTAKPGYGERLPPEARNATEISHPNVCKTFEIHTAETDRGQIDFLTMEFLDGETLKERLKRAPVPEKEARAIASQLCAGLAEAHGKGVIHGDLKSSNVILASAPGGGIRAVITDFGLARRQQTTLYTIQSGALGGTPDYMAPELWKGQKASVASDIYALGVILYELISGRRPYGPLPPWGATRTLSRQPGCLPEKGPQPPVFSWEERLTRRPPPVHSGWDRVLLRCLDPDPARRFAGAEQVGEALAPRSRRWILAAAAALAFAVISGVLAYDYASQPTLSVRLALAPVAWSSPELMAVADRLSNQIAGQLSRIRGGKVARVSFVPPRRVAGAPGLTHVLHVTVRREQSKLILEAVLSEADSGGTLKDWSLTYAPGEERYAPGALAGMVTGTLGLPGLAVTPVNAAARADYAQGVTDTRQNSTLTRALAALQRAAEEDRDSPLTHAALAEAEWFQYYYTKDRVWLDRARESLQRAQTRDPDTAPAHRVEGYLYYTHGLYGTAQAELMRAVKLEPENATAHIWLAKAYEDNNQLEPALAEFQTATQVEPKYFRSYQNLAAYYQNRSNYPEEARNLKTALDLAPQEPGLAGLLAAPCMELGKFSQAERYLHVSLKQQETVNANYRLGQALMYEKDDKEAVQSFGRALDLLDGGSAPGGTSRSLVLMYLGIAYRHLKRPLEADEVNRNGLKFAKSDRGENFLDGYVNAFVGYFDAALGNRDAAEEEIERASSLFRNNADIRWRAALTYEELYRRFHDRALRDQTIHLLSSASGPELADLNRWPDLADLQGDSRFITLVGSHPVEEGGDICGQ
jgi:eukaryotic-like serine/threonine-protein kinase